MPFGFELLKVSRSGIRLGRLTTPHGVIETPAFMPVGTLGTVKGITQDALENLGAGMLLANTYHLFLRPGHELIARMGGLHRFMSWPRGLLTDSGGYQVFSLAKIRKVSDEGVRFRSHLDGSEHLLTPEKVVEIQRALGSDIGMVLDECIELPASREQTVEAGERTFEWARRTRAAIRENPPSASNPGQVFFGIVQGGGYADLRRENAQRLTELDFPGYAVGGLAVGEPHELTCEMAAAAAACLPEDRPRYLMGVGKPDDIVGAVLRGVDMFDCVLPTRSGRNGQAFTPEGPLNLRNARFAEDAEPLDPNCGCPACRQFSRAYLHHVVKAGEIIAAMLLTWHNLTFYQRIMAGLRAAISGGNMNEWISPDAYKVL